MTQDLSDLIARLEKAEAPCRELDFRIWRTFFPDQRTLLDPGGINPLRGAVWGTLADLPTEGWEDYRGAADHVSAHPVTSSLDAALSLAERVFGKVGTFWRFRLDYPVSGNCDNAYVNLWAYPKWEGVSGEAPTPALALVSAILKAVEAGKVEGRE